MTMEIVLISLRSFFHTRMFRSVRNIFVAIALFVTMVTAKTLVTEFPSNRNAHSADNDEPWLADGSFYDVVENVDNVPQADGHPIVVELCPRVPSVLPTGGCALKKCKSDRECTPLGLMCCYNGCVYTCRPQVRPGAYFDWLREPRRRIQYGKSWVIQGRDKEQNLISCSTTKPDDDSDPLLCPHGYECVIDNQGDPSKGVPNVGHCVESVDTGSEEKEDTLENQTNKSQIEVPKVESKHHCKIDDNLQLISGHSAIVNGKNCLCFEKELKCED